MQRALLGKATAEPLCLNLTGLFYGPDPVDHPERVEAREVREAQAKSLCGDCQLRMPCLEKALVWEAMHGVVGRHGIWGGMTADERQRLSVHIRQEGYHRIPTGEHLIASIQQFYAEELRSKRLKERKLKKIMRKRT